MKAKKPRTVKVTVKPKKEVTSITIVGYEVINSIPYYSVKIGVNSPTQVISYSDLLLAEAIHQVPTICAIPKEKL
jgi:hypothetical protein